jgi:DNA invertase Pin-like site-specific DNA recombinase
MKVAIYTRVSTKDQNLKNQTNILLEYADKRGFKLSKMYEDIGSGAKEDRVQLEQLLNDAHKKKFDVVLVWRFDRFARSTSFLIKTLEEFRLLGIDFISYQENIDTSTPTGKVMFTMISAFAEFEREIIRERVLAGLERARKEGKKLGRPKLSGTIREKVVKLRKEGKSYREIRRKLMLK